MYFFGKRTVIKAAALVMSASLLFGALSVRALTDYVLGDVNSDGTVDAKDAALIKSNVTNGICSYLEAGDIYYDGKLNSRDVLYLKAAFAQLLPLSELEKTRRTTTLLLSGDWNEEIRDAVNGMILSRGIVSDNYDGHTFAVFDSISSLDLADLYTVYRLEHMAFPYTQRDINNLAYEIMGAFPEDSAEFAECKALRSSISSAFKSLRQKYGDFTLDGVGEDTADTLRTDTDWQSFAVCMARLSIIAEENDLSGALICSADARDVYKAAKACFEYYKGKAPETVNWTSGENTVTFTVGDPGTGKLLPLWRAFSDNGIGVWLTGSCECEILRAAVDVYGLHDYCTGIIGTTPERTGAVNAVTRADAENYPWRAVKDGWTAEITPVGSGNISAVNALAGRYYGQGPAAVFARRGNDLLYTFADTTLAVVIEGTDIGAAEKITPTGTVSYPTPDYGTVIPADTPSELTVFSLNVRCGDDPDGHSIGERRPRVKAEIDAADPDVIGLQEVVPQWLDILYEDYGEEYEIYNLWRDTAELESSPILWKRDKFECTQRGAFWLSDSPDYMSDGYDPVKRACLFVRLREKATGKEFVAMNTHVGFIEENQRKSCAVICDYARRISDLPTFIVGDFNLQHGTLGYNEMTSYFADVNAATAKDPGETFHGYYHGYEPTELVDYCFERKMTAVSSEVLRETFDGKYVSDHYALRFSLRY